MGLVDEAIAEFQKDKVGKTRNFVAVTNEQILNECLEPRQMAWMVDVSDEARPFPVSGYTASEASGGYCARGRFGAHMEVELVNDGPVTLVIDSGSPKGL